jgi:hypothetical protein
MTARYMDNKTLIIDLVEWLAREPRSYADVMDAWRTSCPRFPIWEDALELGLVAHVNGNGAGPMVDVTAAGKAFLLAERPA